MPKKQKFKPSQVKKTKMPNLGAWLTNAGKSIGSATFDVLRETMPASMDMVTSASEFVQDLRSNMTDMKSQRERVNQALDIGYWTNLAKTAKTNTLEDIKTGKLYHSAYDFDDDDDFDLDFGDDFDMGGDDDFDVDYSSEDGTTSVTTKHTSDEDGSTDINQVNVKVDVGNNSKLIESLDNQTRAAADIAETQGKIIKGSTNLIYTEMAKNNQFLEKTLGSIESNTATVTTAIGVISESASASLKYYNDSMTVFNSILSELTALKEIQTNSNLMGNKDELREYDDVTDLFTGSGVLDLEAYGKLVKKQLGSAIDKNMITMTIKNMLSDKDMLSEMLKHPLNTVVTTTIKQIFPAVMREAANEFDNTLANFLPAALTQLKGLSESDNPILQILGDTFGIQNKLKTTVDKSNYKRGKVDFDGQTHKTINEVIPYYLRKMTAVLTGQREMAFDYNKGVFDSVYNMRENYKNDDQRAMTSGFSSMKSDFSNYMGNFVFENSDDEKKMREAIDKLSSTLVTSTEALRREKDSDGQYSFRGGLAKLLNSSPDDDTIRFISAFFDAMPSSVAMELLGQTRLSSRAAFTKRKNMEESGQLLTNGMYVDNGDNTVDSHMDKLGRVKNGNSLIDTDKYGKRGTYYLRQITRLLATGIRTFPQIQLKTVYGTYGPEYRLVTQGNHGFNTNVISEQQHENKSWWDRHNTATNNTLDALQSQSDAYDDQTTRDEQRLHGTNMTEEQLAQAQARGKILVRRGNDTSGISQAQLVATANDQRAADMSDDSEQQKDFWLRMTGLNSNSALSQIVYKFNEYMKKPSQAVVDVFHKADDFLYKVVFGGDFGPHGSLFDRTIKFAQQQFSRFANWLNDSIFEPLSERLFGSDGIFEKFKRSQMYGDMNQLFKSSSVKLIGEYNEETGKYEGGFASGMANGLAEYGNSVKEALVGEEDSVLSDVKDSFSKIMDNVQDIIGTDRPVDENGDPLGFVDSIYVTARDVIKTRFNNFLDAAIGPDDPENTKREMLKAFGADMEGKGGKIGAGAVLGVIGSLFTPLGPVGGAIVGAGTSIVKESEVLQQVLFGKRDLDGNREGGLISREIINAYEDNKSGIRFGMTAGLLSSIGIIPGFFFPGGPIGGALVGGAVSMVYHMDSVQRALFGEDITDEDGNIIHKDGFVDKLKHAFGEKNYKELGIDAGLGAGVGLIGSFFLPGGPIVGALVGAAASIGMNTEKFQDIFFGELDEDGKRHGGLLEKATNIVTGPLKEGFDYMQIELQQFFEERILEPISTAFMPIVEEARQIVNNTVDAVKTMVKGVGEKVHEMIIAPTANALKTFTEPLLDAGKKVVNTMFRAIGGIATSPFKMLEVLSYGLNRKHMKQGTRSFLDETVGNAFTLDPEKRKKMGLSESASLGERLAGLSSFLFSPITGKGKTEGKFGKNGAYYAEIGPDGKPMSAKEASKKKKLEIKEWNNYKREQVKNKIPKKQWMSRAEFDEQNELYNWTGAKPYAKATTNDLKTDLSGSVDMRNVDLTSKETMIKSENVRLVLSDLNSISQDIPGYNEYVKQMKGMGKKPADFRSFNDNIMANYENQLFNFVSGKPGYSHPGRLDDYVKRWRFATDSPEMINARLRKGSYDKYNENVEAWQQAQLDAMSPDSINKISDIRAERAYNKYFNKLNAEKKKRTNAWKAYKQANPDKKTRMSREEFEKEQGFSQLEILSRHDWMEKHGDKFKFTKNDIDKSGYDGPGVKEIFTNARNKMFNGNMAGQFASGGLVRKTGLYLLSRGERVDRNGTRVSDNENKEKLFLERMNANLSESSLKKRISDRILAFADKVVNNEIPGEEDAPSMTRKERAERARFGIKARLSNIIFGTKYTADDMKKSSMYNLDMMSDLKARENLINDLGGIDRYNEINDPGTNIFHNLTQKTGIKVTRGITALKNLGREGSYKVKEQVRKMKDKEEREKFFREKLLGGVDNIKNSVKDHFAAWKEFFSGKGKFVVAILTAMPFIVKIFKNISKFGNAISEFIGHIQDGFNNIGGIKGIFNNIGETVSDWRNFLFGEGTFSDRAMQFLFPKDENGNYAFDNKTETKLNSLRRWGIRGLTSVGSGLEYYGNAVNTTGRNGILGGLYNKSKNLGKGIWNTGKATVDKVTNFKPVRGALDYLGTKGNNLKSRLLGGDIVKNKNIRSLWYKGPEQYQQAIQEALDKGGAISLSGDKVTKISYSKSTEGLAGKFNLFGKDVKSAMTLKRADFASDIEFRRAAIQMKKSGAAVQIMEDGSALVTSTKHNVGSLERILNNVKSSIFGGDVTKVKNVKLSDFGGDVAKYEKYIAESLDAGKLEGLSSSSIITKGAKSTKIAEVVGTKKGLKGAISDVAGRVGQWGDDVTKGALGKVSQWGDDVVKGATKLGEKAVNSKIGQLGKKAVTGVADIATSSETINKMTQHITGAVDTLKGGINKLLKKFGKGASGKATSIFSRIDDCITKVLKPGNLMKYSGKFLKGLASSLAIVTMITGAISGAADAANLFAVSEDQVDMKMRAISTLWGTFKNAPAMIGFIIDLINTMVADTMGINFVREISTLIYKVLVTDAEAEKLTNAQDKFQQEYNAKLDKDYQEFIKTENAIVTDTDEEGNTYERTMTIDEYKQSEYAQSFEDYNAKQNKTLTNIVMEKIGGKDGLKGAVKKTWADAKNSNIIDQVRKLTDGSFWEVSEYDEDGNKKSKKEILIEKGLKILQAPVEILKGVIGSAMHIFEAPIKMVKAVLKDFGQDSKSAMDSINGVTSVFKPEYWNAPKTDSQTDEGNLRTISFYTNRILMLIPSLVIGIAKTGGRLIGDIADKAGKGFKVISDNFIDFDKVKGLQYVFSGDYWKAPDDPKNPMNAATRAVFYGGRLLTLIPAAFIGICNDIGRLFKPIVDPIREKIAAARGWDKDDLTITTLFTGIRDDGKERTGMNYILGASAQLLKVVPAIVVNVASVVGKILTPLVQGIGIIFSSTFTGVEDIVTDPGRMFTKEYWTWNSSDTGSNHNLGGFGLALHLGSKLLAIPAGLAIKGAATALSLFTGIVQGVIGFVGASIELNVRQEKLILDKGIAGMFTSDFWTQDVDTGSTGGDILGHTLLAIARVSTSFFRIPIFVAQGLIISASRFIKDTWSTISAPFKSSDEDVELTDAQIRKMSFTEYADISRSNSQYNKDDSDLALYAKATSRLLMLPKYVYLNYIGGPVKDAIDWTIGILGTVKKWVGLENDENFSVPDIGDDSEKSFGDKVLDFFGFGDGDTSSGNGPGKKKSGRNRRRRLAGGNGNMEMENGFPYYSQNDPSIANSAYNVTVGQSDVVETMGNRGCGPTALAMVASGVTGQKYSPQQMAQYAEQGLYSTNAGTSPGYFGDIGSRLGMNVTNTDATANNIGSMLNSGQPVILQGASTNSSSPYTEGGHYVVAVGYDNNGNVLVNDPMGKTKSKSYSMDALTDGGYSAWGFSDGNDDGNGNGNVNKKKRRGPLPGGNGLIAIGALAASAVLAGIFIKNKINSNTKELNRQSMLDLKSAYEDDISLTKAGKKPHYVKDWKKRWNIKHDAYDMKHKKFIDAKDLSSHNDHLDKILFFDYDELLGDKRYIIGKNGMPSYIKATNTSGKDLPNNYKGSTDTKPTNSLVGGVTDAITNSAKSAYVKPSTYVPGSDNGHNGMPSNIKATNEKPSKNTNNTTVYSGMPSYITQSMIDDTKVRPEFAEDVTESSPGWIQTVQSVKAAIAEFKPKYNQGGSVDIIVDGRHINVRTDCSGLVSACLDAYGAIKEGTKLSSSSLNNKNNPAIDTNKFKSMSFPGWNKLVAGDILVKNGHTEIYAGINENGKHSCYDGGTSDDEKGIGLCNPGADQRDGSKVFTTVWRCVDLEGNANLAQAGDTTANSDNISSFSGMLVKLANSMMSPIKTAFFGTSDDSDTSTSSSSSSSSGKSNVTINGSTSKEKIFNSLTSDGNFTSKAASGIMGCWESESTNKPDTIEGYYLNGFPGYDKIADSNQALNDFTTGVLFPYYASKGISINKSVYKASDGNYYPGFGLAQWTGEAGKELQKYSKDNDADWQDLSGQLGFFYNDDTYGVKKVKGLVDGLNKSSSAEDAATLFLDKYEMRNDTWHTTSTGAKQNSERRANAKAIYNKYAGGNGSGKKRRKLFGGNGQFADKLRSLATTLSKPITKKFYGTEATTDTNNTTNNTTNTTNNQTASNNNTSAMNLQGSSVAEQVWNYYRGKGFSKEATAAIMGNFYQESGLNPAREAGAASGIAMFEKATGNFANLQKYASSRGKSWTDLGSQLDYLNGQLSSAFTNYTGKGVHRYPTGALAWWPTKMSLNDFKNMSDIALATEVFERVYERASKPNMPRRTSAAKGYYNVYSNKTGALGGNGDAKTYNHGASNAYYGINSKLSSAESTLRQTSRYDDSNVISAISTVVDGIKQVVDELKETNVGVNKFNDKELSVNSPVIYSPTTNIHGNGNGASKPNSKSVKRESTTIDQDTYNTARSIASGRLSFT